MSLGRFLGVAVYPIAVPDESLGHIDVVNAVGRDGRNEDQVEVEVEDGRHLDRAGGYLGAAFVRDVDNFVCELAEVIPRGALVEREANLVKLLDGTVFGVGSNGCYGEGIELPSDGKAYRELGIVDCAVVLYTEISIHVVVVGIEYRSCGHRDGVGAGNADSFGEGEDSLGRPHAGIYAEGTGCHYFAGLIVHFDGLACVEAADEVAIIGAVEADNHRINRLAQLNIVEAGASEGEQVGGKRVFIGDLQVSTFTYLHVVGVERPDEQRHRGSHTDFLLGNIDRNGFALDGNGIRIAVREVGAAEVHVCAHDSLGHVLHILVEGDDNLAGQCVELRIKCGRVAYDLCGLGGNVLQYLEGVGGGGSNLRCLAGNSAEGHVDGELTGGVFAQGDDELRRVVCADAYFGSDGRFAHGGGHFGLSHVADLAGIAYYHLAEGCCLGILGGCNADGEEVSGSIHLDHADSAGGCAVEVLVGGAIIVGTVGLDDGVADSVSFLTGVVAANAVESDETEEVFEGCRCLFISGHLGHGDVVEACIVAVTKTGGGGLAHPVDTGVFAVVAEEFALRRDKGILALAEVKALVRSGGGHRLGHGRNGNIGGRGVEQPLCAVDALHHEVVVLATFGHLDALGSAAVLHFGHLEVGGHFRGGIGIGTCVSNQSGQCLVSLALDGGIAHAANVERCLADIGVFVDNIDACQAVFVLCNLLHSLGRIERLALHGMEAHAVARIGEVVPECNGAAHDGVVYRDGKLVIAKGQYPGIEAAGLTIQDGKGLLHVRSQARAGHGLRLMGIAGSIHRYKLLGHNIIQVVVAR